METYYGCDAHKRYSIFVPVTDRGQKGQPVRVEHTRAMYRAYLEKLPEGTPIAVETIGNWYWMIDEMERAGHVPKLAHAGKAKLMMGQINKTDKLDAGGLATLLLNGSLPEVWIPPAEVRDQRELPRMRMSLVGVRTMLKNRIHATLAKYLIEIEASDVFGVKGREEMKSRLGELPEYTRAAVVQELKLLDDVEEQIKISEERIREVVAATPEMGLLRTMPGVGPILAVVMALEIGDISRFPGPENLASYAGTVPRVKASGDRMRFGKTRPDVNRYLKWALIEAANCVVLNQGHWGERHVVQVYQRIRERKGHAKAVVALARHLAEAAYWVLKKKESYREPHRPISSNQT